MKTTSILLLILTLASACDSSSKVAPVSERIQKSWSVRSVKENSAAVFTNGATGNTKPGYANFRLDLSTTGTVRLTDIDGTTFVGQWSVSADEKTLTLTGLTPQPTGTNGTISFTISSITDDALVIIRTTANQKTGNTINEYTLKNP